MNRTNKDILETALKQSAVDANCNKEDFLCKDNITVISENNSGARKYLELPFDCHLISYGNNIVASVSEKCRDIVSDYIGRFKPEHCFETPNMHVLNDGLEKYGLRICFMAEYFLPDLDCLKIQDCPYEVKLLNQKDFSGLYTDT